MILPIAPRHLIKIDDKKTKDAIAQINAEVAKVVNGNLNFGTPQDQAVGQSGNINGSWPGTLVGTYTITTPGVANTEFTVTHNLGRVPTGYDVKRISAAAHIYDSRPNAWTKTQMFLKCDQATVSLVLFVH